MKAQTRDGRYLTSIGEESHFGVQEFACRCGCGAHDIDVALVERLEALRAVVGGPIHIASGVRCEAHNKAVGGAPKSEHVPRAHDPGETPYSRAADLVHRELSPAALYMAWRERWLNGGVGLGASILHVDTREPRMEWTYGPGAVSGPEVVRDLAAAALQAEVRRG